MDATELEQKLATLQAERDKLAEKVARLNAMLHTTTIERDEAYESDRRSMDKLVRAPEQERERILDRAKKWLSDDQYAVVCAAVLVDDRDLTQAEKDWAVVAYANAVAAGDVPPL